MGDDTARFIKRVVDKLFLFAAALHYDLIMRRHFVAEDSHMTVYGDGTSLNELVCATARRILFQARYLLIRIGNDGASSGATVSLV